MPRKTALIIALVLTAAAALVPVASGAVRDSRGRFLFEPMTHGNHDPLNLIQIGGQPFNLNGSDQHCWFSDHRIAHTPSCLADHAGEAWKRGEMKDRNVPPCNGKDSLTFRSQPPRTDNLNRDISTNATCKTQFNMRIWDDDAVNSPYGEWSLGVVYHETRGFCSFCDFQLKGDHKVDEDWETAENVALWEFGTSTNGEQRYCVQHDYRPVPGQLIGRDSHGNFNDGKISRISVGQPDPVVRPSDECVGR